MNTDKDIDQVRDVLRQFQAGYTSRDLSSLDEFLGLFDQYGSIELIGVGASERGGNEWFEGLQAIREIIQSDWEYWGQVEIDVQGAKISVQDQVAWFTTTGTLEQTDTFDQSLSFYLDQMRGMLEDDEKDPDEKLLEASHFGVRRLRERLKGAGYQWPFVISAVLIKKADGWKFHTIHWSMPVD
jgi:hypothetical protein